MAKNNKRHFTNQIRIIGGCWRGRKLIIPNIIGLRPTTSRAREMLFNWLSPVIQGARCLDCFAGSGALSFEALSRSASSSTLLEKNRIISTYLTRNIIMLQTQQALVVTNDILRWLKQSFDVFDIVFIDPPFCNNIINATVIALEQNHHLAKYAWIYIETEKNISYLNIPKYWQLHRKKIIGKVSYILYIRNSSSA